MRVPIVHLKAIPGCETANAKYFAERGLAVRTRTVRSAVRVLKDVKRTGISVVGKSANILTRYQPRDKAAKHY